MIWIYYFCKKNCFLFWPWPMGTLFLQVGSKNGNFQIFQQKNFTTTGFRIKFLKLIKFSNIFNWKPAKKDQSGCGIGQNLCQIRSNVVEKVKKQALSLGFSYFTRGIPFKEKGSGYKWQLQLEMAKFK